jgi:hypothetical protein
MCSSLVVYVREQVAHSFFYWVAANTIGFGVFVESRHPLGEGLFPHGRAFTERKLSAKATRWSPAGKGPFVESRGSPSRCMCAERPQLLSAKVVFEKKAQGPPRPHHLVVAAARHRLTVAATRHLRRRTHRDTHTDTHTDTRTHLDLPPPEPTTVGFSRHAAAGSAATAPRPTAAPRHEVRGERRGEEGSDVATPADVRRREGGRRQGRRHIGDRGGGRLRRRELREAVAGGGGGRRRRRHWKGEGEGARVSGGGGCSAVHI